MGHVHVERLVHAPVDRVWDLAVDVSTVPADNPYMEIRDVHGSLAQVGTTFESTLKLLGMHTNSTGSVAEIEPHRLIHITGLDRDGSRSDWRYHFVPEADTTRLSLDVDYEIPGGAFGRAMDRIVFERAFDRAMRHMAENFEALAEMTVPQPA